MNYKPLAEEAIKCTQAGELTIDPKSPENEWYRWLEVSKIGVSLDNFGGVTDVPPPLSELRDRNKM